MKNSLSFYQGECQSLIAKYQEYEQEISTKTAEILKLKTEVASLEPRQEALRSQFNQLLSKNVALTEENTRVHSELSRIKQDSSIHSLYESVHLKEQQLIRSYYENPLSK